MDTATAPLAPELEVQRWFNTSRPLSLSALRGRVVALHAFQMLCPGCVSHGLPQAQRMHEVFAGQGLQVLGLHSVVEHHQVMGPEALTAFIHEYRLPFPIAVDRPGSDGPLPMSMRALQLRGTPSLVLIDRGGRIRLHHFGRLDDMRVGAAVARLLAEDGAAASAPGSETEQQSASGGHCSDGACALPERALRR
ncbi:peroxiredoxin family protein [Pseudomarimonas salicorniae]|uniref:TlpA family protein disulfide reductase n=1 Tax=Pseudomarimonas salicorniae TaxID=2933270 RepID=A0ABT0GCX3_9GAMM|nr:TlpA disulfide reductase family protein [Lysobacter sp. CAU 1642]MCK7592273.1 TlpA family protein disulfide reductase [Lysobacter sp. CAU 1642]